MVDTGVGIDISNAATNDRAYATNLGLSNTELRAKVANSNGGTITFGEATAGRLEAHDFNYNISNRTTPTGKKVKSNDDDTTSGNTLAGNSFVTTGEKTPTAIMKHHAGHDLDEEEDNDNFAFSIASVISMESMPVDNMDAEDFHDAQDGVPKPDEQPNQGGKVIDIIPVKIEASQTKLITKAVEKLEMDSEGNIKADSTEEDDKSGNGGDIHISPLETGAMTLTMKSKERMRRNKMRHSTTNIQTQSLSTNICGTKQAPT